MVKRRQRSDKSAVNFSDTDIHVPTDEDVFGALGTSDLENQPVEVAEFAGISTREAAVLRYQEARNAGASAEELAELEAKIAELEELTQSAIIPVAGNFQLGRFTLSSVGLEVPPDISEGEWLALMQRMRGLDSGVAWALGALTNHAESTWGQTYEQVGEITGYKYQTLADYAWLDRAIPFSIRIEKLSPSHHRAVAGLKDDSDKAYWLQQAAEQDWSVAELKRQISDASKSTVQTVEDESWLFQRERVPSLRGTHLQKLWTKARTGDKSARKALMSELQEARKWLDEVENSVD
jgi:hypothetical protein